MSAKSICFFAICVIVTVTAQSIVENERRDSESDSGFSPKSRQAKKGYMMSLYREKKKAANAEDQITARSLFPKSKGRKEHSALMRSEIVRSFKSKDSKKSGENLVLLFELPADMRTERIRLAQLVLRPDSLHGVSGVFTKIKTTKNQKTIVINVGSLSIESSETQSSEKITFDATNVLRRWSNAHSKDAEDESVASEDTEVALIGDEVTLVVFSSTRDNSETDKQTKVQVRSRRNSERQRRRKQRNRRRNKTDYAKFDAEEPSQETENLNAHGLGNELEASEGVSYAEMQQHENENTVDEASEWEREQNARRHKEDAPTSRSMHRAPVHCRKVPFEVNFDKIGWGEWIIYPKRYQAYRCEGQCSFSQIQNQATTNHAFVQSIYSSSRPDLEIPTPCCVPTKLKPLSLLYFENGEVVQRDHQDMVVEECGCR